MCTFVLLRRPDHKWPVIIGANRDEMSNRPWKAPGRHWADRPHLIAGLDVLADGSWLGLNDDGLVAGVLNRPGTLGPATDKRSRGELPLDALDHAEARVAAEALSHLDGTAYRPFNLVIADAQEAFCLISDGTGPVDPIPLEDGVTIITARGVNETTLSLRAKRFLPLFEGASAPEPDEDTWAEWETLLADTGHDVDGTNRDAMAIQTETGFETVSSALIALPKPALPAVPPVFRFAGGFPGDVPYNAVL